MKIALRSIKISDSPLLFAWVNDRELISHSYYYRPVSELEHNKWFESVFEKRDQLLLGIEISDGDLDLLVGTCGLFDIDQISRKAELRIKIGNKDYWGKGVGTIAVNQLCELGFYTLNLNKIWLKVIKDNIRALKSYQKSGFGIEGELKDDMFIEGEFKDIVIMSKFK